MISSLGLSTAKLPEDVVEKDDIYRAPLFSYIVKYELPENFVAEGRKIFAWTLDESSYIEEFINEGLFDGILTNYPTIVSYYYYIK